MGAAHKMGRPAWYNANRRRNLLSTTSADTVLQAGETTTCAREFGPYVGTAMKFLPGENTVAGYQPAHAWNPADAGVVMSGGDSGITWDSETALYYKAASPPCVPPGPDLPRLISRARRKMCSGKTSR